MSPNRRQDGGFWRARFKAMHRRTLALAAVVGVALAFACGTPHDAPPASGLGSQGEDGGTVDGPVSDGHAGQPDPTAHPLCVNGQSVDGLYPKAAYGIRLLGTAPDLSFEGENGPIALHDYFEPCAARPRILVVRVSAAWCGTCLWSTAHTKGVADLDFAASRLSWLDLLVADRDNVPARVSDLQAFRAQIDVPSTLAIDPSFQLGAVNPSLAPLPLIVLIDTSTMTILNFLTNPDPDLFETRLRQELAGLDHAPAPRPLIPKKFDGLFYRNQWDMLHDMTLPGAPPADTTSAKADDPAAASLGKKLFSDGALSPSGSKSCATCHVPQNQFQDSTAQSHDGVAIVDRNAPTLALAAHSRWQFWDGRADTLWMQALGPIENAKEMGSSRLFVAHRIFANYRADYEAVFGALPALSDAARFPASGMPGDASFLGMTDADRAATTEVFVNVGKSIAAYERTLRVMPNKLDAYVGGDLSALSSPEKSGLYNFFVVGCAQCHWGPRLTDDAFHPDRYPTGRQDGLADRGRIDGIGQLLSNEFSQPHPGLLALSSMLGSFKTPTLRGIAGSAPYGHGGTISTLAEVAKIYGTAGIDPKDPRAVGTGEPWLVSFDGPAQAGLVPFLEILTATPIVP